MESNSKNFVRLADIALADESLGVLKKREQSVSICRPVAVIQLNGTRRIERIVELGMES